MYLSHTQTCSYCAGQHAGRLYENLGVIVVTNLYPCVVSQTISAAFGQSVGSHSHSVISLQQASVDSVVWKINKNNDTK